MKSQSIFKVINIILGLSFISNSNAYIFTKHEFEGNNKIYGWGDVHFGDAINKHPKLNYKQIKEINKQQADHLINFLKNCDSNCCVLVEDITDIENSGFEKEFVKINDENSDNDTFTSFLTDINELCKQNNIKIINVECRYAGTLYFDSLFIKTEKFLKALYETINEIKNYNDNPLLNNYYKKLIQEVLNNKKFISILEQNKDKYYDELKELINEKMHENFFFDYCELVDAKIMHAIHQNKDKNVHICVGNMHIKNIENIIKKLNYKKINPNEKEKRENPLELEKYLKYDVKKLSYNSNYLILILLIVLMPVAFRYLNRRFNTRKIKS